MDPIFDTLTLTAMISVACVMAMVLVLNNCCKMRKILHQLFMHDKTPSRGDH